MGQIYSAIKKLRKESRLSEREASEAASVSRRTLRSFEASETSVNFSTAEKLASQFNREAILLVAPSEPCRPEDTIVVTSSLIMKNGEDSWKTHLFDFVDSFRRTYDPRLTLLPPMSECSPKTKALLASTVSHLCRSVEMEVPAWALKNYFLESPWFPSETEKLKAMAILESPASFRANNIFVLENFLDRV